MKQIKVSDQNGVCLIKSNEELTITNEFLIKSMAMIQLLCVGRNNENDPKLKELVEILDNSMTQINELYNVSEVSGDEPDPFSDY